MSQIKNFIDEVEKKLPDLCSAQDLVNVGLFSSTVEAMLRRKRGDLPEFIYLSKRRIVYPKASVIDWLQRLPKTSKTNEKISEGGQKC